MRRPLVRPLLVGIALAASGLTAAPAALASSPNVQGSDSEVVSQQLATSRAEQQRIASYWTPARMKAAIPADVELTGDHRTVTPAATQQALRPRATPVSPQPRHGKVFFTQGGQNFVCSGTATTSGNRDVVTTAGHCVHSGSGGSGGFSTNFAFVPAFNNGAAPFGQWTASDLFTSSGWANSGDFNVDVGFAVVNENSAGQSLTDVVGSFPVAFNLARGLTYTSFGYPAAPPFNGQSLFSCTGAARPDPSGLTTQGMPCDMTGGASGGGWITGGQLNSVNSYKYSNDARTMYGPFFGSTAQSVYNAAAAA